MQVDAFAVRLRPRTPMEATDLGTGLCRGAATSVYSCYGLAALPIAALAVASYEVASWLPAFVMWWAKPWLDRTILFVLSRAAFGQRTRPAEVWRAQRQVWWSQFFFTATVQRLSLWRALTQPVHQLEGLPVLRAGARVRQIRRRNTGSALMMTCAFSVAELAVMLSLMSLAFWFAPSGQTPDVVELLSGESTGFLSLVSPLAYAMTVFFLEPFYVAAGFAMYLNRRADLEAWDIEQEFRRAFVHPRAHTVTIAAVFLATLSVGAAAAQAQSVAEPRERPGQAEIARAIDIVKADPNLTPERTIKTLRWKESNARRARSPWLAWIAGFFAWLAQSARLLVWGAGVILAGLLILYVVRVLRKHRVLTVEDPLIAPTHVHDLDIRPETLPPDIGAAARALWDRGERRASLALLYRGMLSRFAHVHRIPIRDSTTEGDCLVVAASHLTDERRRYASELVGVWQRSVYGREDVYAATVYMLCDDFASALDSVSPVANSLSPRGGP